MSRLLRDRRGQQGLAVGLPLGVDVDQDLGPREALLELLLDAIEPVVRFLTVQSAGTQTWNCAK